MIMQNLVSVTTMTQSYYPSILLINQLMKDLKSLITEQNQQSKLAVVKRYLPYNYQMIITSIFNGVFQTELIHMVTLMIIIPKPLVIILLLQKIATYD